MTFSLFFLNWQVSSITVSTKQESDAWCWGEKRRYFRKNFLVSWVTWRWKDESRLKNCIQICRCNIKTMEESCGWQFRFFTFHPEDQLSRVGCSLWIWKTVILISIFFVANMLVMEFREVNVRCSVFLTKLSKQPFEYLPCHLYKYLWNPLQRMWCLTAVFRSFTYCISSLRSYCK